ncbi:MAG: TonB-dependent receptor [Chitinophagaceae bacterium]
MNKHFFVVAAGVIGSLLCTTTYAQDSSGVSLDEVVITANKYPNKTSSTGKVVTIITREQLEKSGGKDLSQLLTEQTGIYIVGANSNPGKDKNIYLRGARVDHTLITIDGVPVYDPSGIGGNFDIRNLALSNIERIEILKGSQSTLYGSDAIAGVINIITRKPAGKTIGGNALLSYGSYGTVKANAGINGRSGKVDYNAGYSFHNSKGINETVNKANAPVTDKDGFTQNGFQLGLGIKPTEKIYIQPFLRYGNINGDIDQGAFTDELDYTYTQKSWQAGIRNELTFGKSKLVLLYNYNNINRTYTDDSVKSRNGFDTYAKGTYTGHEHFLDAYLHVPFSDQLKLTAGADYRHGVTDQEYFSVGFFGPFTSKYSSDSLNQNQVGAYAALNWNTKTGFNLEVGSRINFHSAYGNHVVYNINPSYHINKKVKVFANISSGYRTPSLYQLYSEYGNENLEPEAASTGEAGVQFISSKNKFTGRMVGFSRSVKDVIFFYFNSTTFQSQYINQDKQKDKGVEIEAGYKINSGTTVKAFYTYTTGKVTTRQNGKDTTYFNLIRRPKSTLGLNVSSHATKKLFISSNLSLTGKREDAYFDNTTFTTVNTTLKSYALLDVYAEYVFFKNKLKMFADLRNITSTDYTEISGFNTMGFNGTGGIRFTF